jgi:hypothetical protein
VEAWQTESVPKLQDSPTFKKAMLNLGLSSEDIKRKTIEDFKVGSGADRSVTVEEEIV